MGLAFALALILVALVAILAIARTPAAKQMANEWRDAYREEG